MGMYARVELMTCNWLFDLPEKEIIYIYKLSSKYTDHFYIGQTGSIKDRMYVHLSTIVKIIEGNECNPLPVHKIIAAKIKELHEKDKRTKIEKFTRDCLQVDVIAIVSNKEAANLVENHYINKNKLNPLFLNSTKKNVPWYYRSKK